MNDQLDVVTGAFSYTGRYIATRLLADGHRVRTLTGHPDRDNPFGGEVTVAPYTFDDPVQLTRSLEGASTLFNTYWVRFGYGSVRFDDAIENSRALFQAARRAGVERIVHVSITNPSIDSPYPYFRGKALVERALAESGVPYTIVRPTVVFGREDVLVNNIAWLLRHFPVFAVAGSGAYRLRPVFVDDVARLCVEGSRVTGDDLVDAVGPETFQFDELVRAIGMAIDRRVRLVHVTPLLVRGMARLIGVGVRDVVLTGDELAGMMAELVVTDGPTTGETALSEWLSANRDWLGTRYASELDRHFVMANA